MWGKDTFGCNCVSHRPIWVSSECLETVNGLNGQKVVVLLSIMLLKFMHLIDISNINLCVFSVLSDSDFGRKLFTRCRQGKINENGLFLFTDGFWRKTVAEITQVKWGCVNERFILTKPGKVNTSKALKTLKGPFDFSGT